jgi:serine/threonine-protein kinase
VYLASRDDGTYEQTAAFKVLRRGLDTDDLVARFRAERQFLSTLDHPSIAQILDGGSLPDGRPYLVLEYVDGLPITDWCEHQRSSIDERIRLLFDVLKALHHAHKHLIVHRDIKQSNILI